MTHCINGMLKVSLILHTKIRFLLMESLEIQFERCGCSAGREGLTKSCIMGNVGSREFDSYRGLKVRHFDHSVFNLSLVSGTLYLPSWKVFERLPKCSFGNDVFFNSLSCVVTCREHCVS